MEPIRSSLHCLRAYVEREEYGGYDPYDALKSSIPWSKFGKWPPIFAIQVLKRLPVNIRPVLGIPKGRNPKGIGLFLHGYSLLYQREGREDYHRSARRLFDWLALHDTPGYSGRAWGYDFPWASPVKHLDAFTPSVVVTSFVAKGMLAYFDATGDKRALSLARSACEFVLRDLPRHRTEAGLCFSYSPVMRDCCYNASLLGAELLILVYARTGEGELLRLATEVVDFVVAHQKEDGRWNYSIDLETGTERAQVDFHQGFILDSLLTYVEATGSDDPRYLVAIERGARFYAEHQFNQEGRALWRLPRQWPVDIHHQAQGVITFSRLSARLPQYATVAQRIAEWTVQYMQRTDGAFAYRKYSLMTDKVPYMRWGQAWMFLALVTFLGARADAQ